MKRENPIQFLAGDLGGTKTFLAIYEWCGGELIEIYQQRYRSSDWDCLESMLNNFFKKLPPELKKPKEGCIAVAGPVNNGVAKITNLSWNLNEASLCKACGLDQLEIINDFSVLIYGLPFLKDSQTVKLQGPKGVQNISGQVAIIGAGTGLGIARGFANEECLFSLPSEGGHQEFAPRNEQEWELAQWLKRFLRLKRISIERIVSGNGLGHIAQWLLDDQSARHHPLKDVAEIWHKKTPESSNWQDLPSLISKAAKEGDPLMGEALKIWLSAYGSAAGDLAVQEMCRGGLWIGGGTAHKHLSGLRSNFFLDAMRNKGRFKPFIESLPVSALIDPKAGLFSAACRALMIALPSGRLS